MKGILWVPFIYCRKRV